MQTNNNDVLSHHGVKGQKWGVRNYQYKDGSLTPKGKKRLGIGTVGAKLNKARKATAKKVSELHKKSVAKKELKKAEKEANAYKHKSAKDMSDEELNKAINRARMEDQYNALRPEPVSKGKAFINTIGGQVIKPALISSGRRALENVINKAVDDALKDKVDPNSIEALTKTAEKLRTKEEIKLLKEHGVTSWENVNKKLNAQETIRKRDLREENERETAKAEAEAAKQAKAEAKAAKKAEAESKKTEPEPESKKTEPDPKSKPEVKDERVSNIITASANMSISEMRQYVANEGSASSKKDDDVSRIILASANTPISEMRKYY